MKLTLIFLGLILVFIGLLAFFFKNIFAPAPTISVLTPSPSPTPLIILKQAVPADAYTIVMIGDSMTEALGPNADKLREYLKIHYPDKTFGIFNLAKGSTSLLSVQSLLENDILNREFEVILIESFGYNPLSDLPLEEGLEKQTQILDQIVKTIRQNKTNAKVKSIIVFVATIAPNKDKYATNAVELSDEEREKWANERSSYIENHIKYAKDHGIPLVNIYEKSLDKEKVTGDLQYIQGDTFIHPSKEGIDLISKEIADFLYNEKILPN